jgi:protocatechuate 3,4-dioxygenase beta subunit
MPSSQRLTRRRLLRLTAAAGALSLVPLMRSRELAGVVDGLAGTNAAAATDVVLACVLSPAKTEGPYFVDERLNRSDIRVDASTGSVEPGVPLLLRINLYDAERSCAAVQGATVDVWHANAAGTYSDVSANGTVGREYLRGYQVSDANGSVAFRTVYPGWYSGRAIHIHFKVRLFDDSTRTYEFTSQIFFDEAITNAVMTQQPYSSRGTPNTRNANDNIYGSDGSRLTATVTSDGSGGYVATFDVGLSGLPSSTGTTDRAVSASLAKTSWRRVAGLRRLVLTLTTSESVSVDARLTRGATVLSRKSGNVAAGTRTVTLVLPRRIGAGGARVRLVLADGAGNEKVVQRAVTVPRQ